MGKEKNNGDPLAKQDLAAARRQAAEAQLQACAQSSPAMGPDELLRLVHELQVHQIELEMQNEEMQQVQMELDAERKRYSDLYNQAPVGYCTVSDAGLILQANFRAASLLGVKREALVNKPISRFILKDDQDAYDFLHKQIITTGKAQSYELRMTKSHGAPVWVHLSVTVGQDAGGVAILRVAFSDITERKQIEAALYKSEAFNLAILDSLSVEIAVLDHEGTIVAVNRAWRRFASDNHIGHSGSASYVGVGTDYLAVCQSASDLMSEDALSALKGIQAVLEGRVPSYSQEYPCHSPKEQRWYSMNVTPFGDGVVIAHINITERMFAEDALRVQEEFFHLIAENIGDFIAVLDREGRRLYNSPSYTQFFGGLRDLRGTDSFADIHPADQEYVKRVFRETVQSGRGRQIDYRLLIADGSIREMESHGSVIKDEAGRVVRVVVVSHDITERKQLEEQVRQMAFHDALTGLPNRRLLDDRLSQSMAASARSGCYGAVMFLDLDNFKKLNDTHGHTVGDLLLVEVAERLRHCVREADTVARFGGDEFVLMISELEVNHAESRVQAKGIAEKILITLSEPYPLVIKSVEKSEQLLEHRCTASIGVGLFVNHECSQSDVLKWADAAMYQAKAAGGNAFWFHEMAV